MEAVATTEGAVVMLSHDEVAAVKFALDAYITTEGMCSPDCKRCVNINALHPKFFDLDHEILRKKVAA